ncbi:MAG: hypothetical protein ABIP65_08165 [Vicinamibacterales bacterium]
MNSPPGETSPGFQYARGSRARLAIRVNRAIDHIVRNLAEQAPQARGLREVTALRDWLAALDDFRSWLIRQEGFRGISLESQRPLTVW